MAAIPGSIPVTGFIAPTDTADTFATHNQLYGAGGLKSVETLAERDAITEARRFFGMFCSVYNDGTTTNNGVYRLVRGLSSTSLTDNGNWELFISDDEGLTPQSLVIPPSTQVNTGKKETFPCLVVTADNSPVISTGISIAPNNDVYPTIEINNHELSVGDGVTTEQCYLAAPGQPLQPRGFNPASTFGKIQIGDVIYINPSLIGYNIDVNDEITIKF